jgi:DNA replication protein DnaC
MQHISTIPNEINGQPLGNSQPMIERVTVNCATCGTPFTTSKVRIIKSGTMTLLEVDCEECKQTTVTRPNVSRDYRREWEEMCPRQFLDTDPKRIPDVVLREFRRYQFSNLGITAIGSTGTFKSRSMHLLMRRLFFEGRSVKLFDAIRLGVAIGDSFDNDGYGVLIDNLSVVDALSIDDLDKAKLTDRIQEGFYAIIDRRIQNKLPTFITTNIDGAILERLFLPQYGPALRRRLRESSTIIQTDKLLNTR